MRRTRSSAVSAGTSLHRVWRYTATGGVATTSHYLLTGALIELREWTPGPASVIGAALGAIVSFGLNHTWTFAGHGVPYRQTGVRFLSVSVVGALLHGLLVWGATLLLGTHWLVAQAAATFIVLLAGYIANRDWSFSRRC